MSQDEFDADAVAESMLAYLGLPDEPAYRPGITTHLASARGIAAGLLALPMDDEAEPATVFKP
ncbi:DUF4089 domain-containing protein [Hoeflea sp.]|uniref:DUF4089 domain-containing protein n=1 Tax=Hoeflea sp. TaxID=1940281 RepID=UPI003A911EF1